MDRTHMLSPGPGMGVALAVLVMEGAGLLGLFAVAGWMAVRLIDLL